MLLLIALAMTLRLDYGTDRALAPEWRVVSYRGRTHYEPQRDSSAAWLRAEAKGKNSALFWPLDRDVRGATLSWKWRALRHPVGADTRVRSRDDRTAAVFIMVHRSILPWRTKGLLYQWAQGEAPGRWQNSPYASGIKVITLRNSSAIGEWHSEERDLGADLAAAFGTAPERVEAIGVLCDADNTGDVASADIGVLQLTWGVITAPPPPPRP